MRAGGYALFVVLMMHAFASLTYLALTSLGVDTAYGPTAAGFLSGALVWSEMRRWEE